jgi:hypothetical protein
MAVPQELSASAERSIALSEAFVDPVVYRHAGGHFVPSNAESKRVYEGFLWPFVREQRHCTMDTRASLHA